MKDIWYLNPAVIIVVALFLALQAYIWIPRSTINQVNTAAFMQHRWRAESVIRLNKDNLLVNQGFLGIGRGSSRFFGRYLLLSVEDGQERGRYLYMYNGKFVGKAGSLLWFDTKTDGLNGRSMNTLEPVVSNKEVGMGLPAGGIQKYFIDSTFSRLTLLGTDGRYYFVDDRGQASLSNGNNGVDEKPNAARADGEELNSSDNNGSAGQVKARLDDDGDGRYILHIGTSSTVLLMATLIDVHLPNPGEAMLLHYDKLGPTGIQLLSLISVDGSVIWSVHMSDLIGKPVLSKGSVTLFKSMNQGPDVILFIEESARGGFDHVTHVCRLNVTSGKTTWSRELKN
jgi:hypothetical protein